MSDDLIKRIQAAGDLQAGDRGIVLAEGDLDQSALQDDLRLGRNERQRVVVGRLRQAIVLELRQPMRDDEECRVLREQGIELGDADVGPLADGVGGGHAGLDDAGPVREHDRARFPLGARELVGGGAPARAIFVGDSPYDMAAGRATSQSITQASLARIQRLDRAGPRINAVLEHVPAEHRRGMRPVELMVMRPSQDLARDVIADLDGKGLLVAKESYAHSYPHCWRCGTPLIYWAKTSWFARTEEKRADLLGQKIDTRGRVRHERRARGGGVGRHTLQPPGHRVVRRVDRGPRARGGRGACRALAAGLAPNASPAEIAVGVIFSTSVAALSLHLGVALNNRRVIEAFAAKGIVPLKADWTASDPRITATLSTTRPALPVGVAAPTTAATTMTGGTYAIWGPWESGAL